MKKILWSVGIVATATVPLITVVSCGNSGYHGPEYSEEADALMKDLESYELETIPALHYGTFWNGHLSRTGQWADFKTMTDDEKRMIGLNKLSIPDGAKLYVDYYIEWDENEQVGKLHVLFQLSELDGKIPHNNMAELVSNIEIPIEEYQKQINDYITENGYVDVDESVDRFDGYYDEMSPYFRASLGLPSLPESDEYRIHIEYDGYWGLTVTAEEHDDNSQRASTSHFVQPLYIRFNTENTAITSDVAMRHNENFQKLDNLNNIIGRNSLLMGNVCETEGFTKLMSELTTEEINNFGLTNISHTLSLPEYEDTVVEITVPPVSLSDSVINIDIKIISIDGYDVEEEPHHATIGLHNVSQQADNYQTTLNNLTIAGGVGITHGEVNSLFSELTLSDKQRLGLSGLQVPSTAVIRVKSDATTNSSNSTKITLIVENYAGHAPVLVRPVEHTVALTSIDSEQTKVNNALSGIKTMHNSLQEVTQGQPILLSGNIAADLGITLNPLFTYNISETSGWNLASSSAEIKISVTWNGLTSSVNAVLTTVALNARYEILPQAYEGPNDTWFTSRAEAKQAWIRSISPEGEGYPLVYPISSNRDGNWYGVSRTTNRVAANNALDQMYQDGGQIRIHSSIEADKLLSYAGTNPLTGQNYHFDIVTGNRAMGLDPYYRFFPNRGGIPGDCGMEFYSTTHIIFDASFTDWDGNTHSAATQAELITWINQHENSIPSKINGFKPIGTTTKYSQIIPA